MATGSVVFDISANDRATAQITKVQNSLKTLEKQTQTTSSILGKFQTVLAGLAIGNLVRSAIGYADAITDIADATGIATKEIVGFSKAVVQNGGDAEKANTALLKFVANIGAAAEGAANSQSAFAEVGISLNDLRTLSEAELFAKTIQGLSTIEDVSKRTVLQNELLGKSLRGVNILGVAGDFDAATAASAKYAESIKAAADLQDRLDRAFSQLKLSILSAIEPLLNFVNNLNPDQINRFVDALVKIGGAAVAITAAVKSFELLGKAVLMVGGAFALFKTGTGQILTNASGLGKTFNWLLSNIKNFANGTRTLGEFLTALGNRFEWLLKGLGGLGAGFVRLIPFVGAFSLAISGINAAIKAAFDVDVIDWFLEKLSQAYNWVAKFVGLPKWEFVSEEDKKRLEETTAATAKQAEEAKKAAEANREVQDAFAKQRAEIQGLATAFQDANDKIANQIQLDTALVGVTAEQADIMKATADLNQRATEEINKLTEAKSKLSKQEQQAGLAQEYDKQIALVKDLAAREQSRLETLIRGLNEAKNLEELRNFQLKSQQNLEDQLLAVQREIANSGLSDIEKKYRDIQAAAEDNAKAAIRAEEARRGTKLDPTEAQAYYQAATQGIDKLYAAQKTLYEGSRTFSAGWKKAFNQYVDEATNAAKIAESVFLKFTSSIEDALVNFVKTGKFEWKDFVNTMGEELLRLSIRSTMGNIMQALGVGDLFGGGGDASKGMTQNNPMYVYDVSGGGAGVMGSLSQYANPIQQSQKSSTSLLGGLWDTVSGWFGSGTQQTKAEPNWYQQTQTPNFYEPWKNQTQPQSTGSWWDSVTSTVSDLFGGWFANGGTLGAGKWGIAGENGPELISGPAQITPMSGGGVTNVTYNINAVDAASFKALVAADPSFIHAVAMQGAKSLPGRR